MGDIRSAAVIGAGLMGSQIAELLARVATVRVTLVDASEELAEQGVSGIARRLEAFFVAKGKMTPEEHRQVLGRIAATADLERAASEIDVAVEAVTENLAVKQALFARLDRAAQPHSVLASNTSYLRIRDLASATARPDRVVGLHFFNPVALMKLVEVVRGPDTSEATVDVACGLARRLGKEPVVCSDASFGFLANRAYFALRLEAVQMVWERVAAPEDIDRALKLGHNLPVGPLELGDLGGSWGIYASSEGDRIRALGPDEGRLHPLVRLMVDAGYTGGPGRKGIYDYYREVFSKTGEGVSRA